MVIKIQGPKNTRARHGREYVWPSRPPYELSVPSSTTIIREGLPKDALQYWATRSVAEYAFDQADAWKSLPRDDAVDLLKRAPYRQTASKAALGSAVHAAIEAYLARRPAQPLEPQERGYFKAALAFLRDWTPEILRVEATIYSRTHGYAGTSDLLATVAGCPAIVDYKTGKAVYADYGVQLASYAYGDFVGDDNDVEVPLADLGTFLRGIVVRLGDDGHYEAVPFDLTPELFDVFLAAKTVYAYKRDGTQYMGEPLPSFKQT